MVPRAFEVKICKLDFFLFAFWKEKSFLLVIFERVQCDVFACPSICVKSRWKSSIWCYCQWFVNVSLVNWQKFINFTLIVRFFSFCFVRRLGRVDTYDCIMMSIYISIKKLSDYVKMSSKSSFVIIL